MRDLLINGVEEKAQTLAVGRVIITTGTTATRCAVGQTTGMVGAMDVGSSRCRRSTGSGSMQCGTGVFNGGTTRNVITTGTTATRCAVRQTTGMIGAMDEGRSRCGRSTGSGSMHCNTGFLNSGTRRNVITTGTTGTRCAVKRMAGKIGGMDERSGWCRWSRGSGFFSSGTTRDIITTGTTAFRGIRYGGDGVIVRKHAKPHDVHERRVSIAFIRSAPAYDPNTVIHQRGRRVPHSRVRGRNAEGTSVASHWAEQPVGAVVAIELRLQSDTRIVSYLLTPHGRPRVAHPGATAACAHPVVVGEAINATAKPPGAR